MVVRPLEIVSAYFPALRADRMPGLDGLRAYAALIVISVHIFHFGEDAWGVTCVWTFFVVSGFLLFRPFVEQDFRFGARDLAGYLLRRMFRIMPLYAVALIAYWATGIPPYKSEPSWLMDHLTFRKADGHLWTVKQEMICYVALPAIAGVCAWVRSRAASLAFVLLLVPATYVAFNVHPVVMLVGGFAWMPVWVTPFVCGMALAFAADRFDARTGLPLLAVGLLGTVALSVGQATTFEAYERLVGLPKDGTPFSHPYLVWPFVCALVLGATLRPTPLFANRAVHMIGVVSFGVYLWHQLILHVVKQHVVSSPWPLYLTGTAASIVLSMVTYRWIERPGIRVGHRLATRIAHRKPAAAVRPRGAETA